MHKSIRKLLEKLNIVLVLTLAIAMTGVLGGASYVLAANTATQQASSGSATTISVVGKAADNAITTITFPEGAPSSTVSAPYNDVDTSSDPQFLDSSDSEPVVRLKNTAGVTYNVTLEITTWTNGVAASEDYELVATGTTNISAVTSPLSTDGNAASVATGVSMASATYKALYLELVLSAVAGKTGTSTLTVLGETA
jgi:hypothetical protein